MLLRLSTLLQVKVRRRSGRVLLTHFAPLLFLTISLHSTGEFCGQDNFCAVHPFVPGGFSWDYFERVRPSHRRIENAFGGRVEFH